MPTLAASANAAALLHSLRDRFQEVVPATANRSSAHASLPSSQLQPAPLFPEGAASSFAVDGNRLHPVFTSPANPVSAGAVAPTAKATVAASLPTTADGPLELTHAASKMFLLARLKGALPAAAEVAEGYVTYRAGHESGADLIRRASTQEVEDYLHFPTRPSVERISYEVELPTDVAELRLVANTLEFLDSQGAPRLRINAPYLIDSAGRRIVASVGVRGCAVDTNPAAPWGRPPIDPNGRVCEVSLDWSQGHPNYPAALDPEWTAGENSNFPHTSGDSVQLPVSNLIFASSELYSVATGSWATTSAPAFFNSTQTVFHRPPSHWRAAISAFVWIKLVESR